MNLNFDSIVLKIEKNLVILVMTNISVIIFESFEENNPPRVGFYS